MKLDPRIKDRKCIFDCFSSNEAINYVGKECYLTDCLAMFGNINILKYGTLDAINDNGQFVCGCFTYTYCLPVEFVAPNEKKFRPFTLDEFLAFAPLGETIVYRYKARTDPDARITALVIEVDHGDGKNLVRFGGNLWSFDEMFRDLEREYEGEWYPFGSAV